MNAQTVTSSKDVVEEVLNDYIDGYYNYVKPSEKYKDDVAIFVEKRIALIVRCNQTCIQINLPIKVGRVYTDVLDEFLDKVKVSLDRLNYVATSHWEIQDLDINEQEMRRVEASITNRTHIDAMSRLDLSKGFKVHCVDYFYTFNTSMSQLHALKIHSSEVTNLIKLDNTLLCTDDSFLDHYEKVDQILILEGYCLTTNTGEINPEEPIAVLTEDDLHKYSSEDNYDVVLVEKKSFTNGKVWYVGFKDISDNVVYKYKYYHSDFPRAECGINVNNGKLITV